MTAWITEETLSENLALRLASNGATTQTDSFGNKVLIDCSIYSQDDLLKFINHSILTIKAKFNLSDKSNLEILNEYYDKVFSVALSSCLGAQVLKEAGREATGLNDDHTISNALFMQYERERNISWQINNKPIDIQGSKSFAFPLKQECEEVLYRVATNQSRKIFQGLFPAQNGFLQSELGISIINLMLGFGLNYAEDERLQKLGKEFRVSALTGVGNQLIKELFDGMFKELPTPSRVEQLCENDDIDLVSDTSNNTYQTVEQ